MHISAVSAMKVGALLLLLFNRAAEAGEVLLAGSVRPLQRDMAVVGEANPAAILHVAIALRMRKLDTLDALNEHHQQVSAAVLDRIYLPDRASYAAICSWLTSSGLAIERAHSSRITIDVAGSVGQLSRVFGLHFSSVVANGIRYISADTAPHIPAAFAGAILGINHLQPQMQPHKLFVRGPAGLNPSALTPEPPFTPADINQAYAAASLGTAGQRSVTGVIIDTLPLTSDLTAYWQMVNIPQSLSNITLIQTSRGTMPSPSGEETLDTELASAFAPAGKVRVYGSISLNRVDDSYEQVISDMQSGIAITQLSISYGGCESEIGSSEIQTEHQYFSTITAMGAAVFAASGDSGIYGCYNRNVEPLYPASDPDVTGVGATTLTFSGASTISQTGWSCDGTAKNCNEVGASGGGLSTMFATPKYQDRIPTATHRAVPDVSLVGDPNTGVLIVFNGRAEQYGGTSVGPPIMAGYTGLINDTRLAAGKAALGAFNPHIYRLALAKNFTDITIGDNGDMAGTGYDLVTGLGTPVMSVLLHNLARQP